MLRWSVLLTSALVIAATTAAAEPTPPRGYLELGGGAVGIGGVGAFAQAGVAGGWQTDHVGLRVALFAGPPLADSDRGNLGQVRVGIERRSAPGGGALYVGADVAGFFADADYVPRPLAMRGALVAPRMGLELVGGPIAFRIGLEGVLGFGFLREGDGPAALPARHEWRHVAGVAASAGLVVLVP